ncbi:protein eva-1 homolog C-like isoform X2 [Patiria miniata]|uniref:SUEL-type lectin domain-containing protein n=1 Tax=Patiria miniata TaxID=46514 RepID=A0A913ZBX6_PATMI|nr:protein eva-1 homolog C-like isoform X2 [Patiria miniata]
MMAELLPVVFTVIVGLTFPYLPSSQADDNPDLLMSTLRSKFVFACDKDLLTFKCPNSTVITIESANYGRQVPSERMCPYRWSTVGSYQVTQYHENTNCKAVNSHQVIENMCESRQFCKLRVSSDLFGGDPCPGTNKYLDVTYKCKPSVFHNVVVCENSHMMLHCNGKEVLAIHSAGFGRPIAANMKCPSFSMDDIECSSSSSLEEVMKRCHGKRHCTVKASTRIFGEPCQAGTYKYLSVIYTCVSKRIFRKPRRYTGAATVPQNFAVNLTTPSPSFRPDYDSQGGTAYTMTEATDFNQGFVTANDSSGTISSTANTSLSEGPPTRNDQDQASGFFTSLLAAIGSIQLNTEVFVLYVSIGCCIGIIGTLLWCVVRLKCQHYHLKKKMEESGTSSNTTEANRTPPGNGSVLESVRQENRVDINEIWNTPPPSASSVRPENGINATRRWEQASTLPREAHTLPATRNLNSYFP